MLRNRNKSGILNHTVLALIGFLLTACSGMGLAPSHYGKFIFQGTVKTPDGKPVPNAWVKVRGWETLTDENGRWKQEQVVHCGALREHPGSYEENDAILVMAQGFKAAEEKFIVKHPSWFNSCDPIERTVLFETALGQSGTDEKSETIEKKSESKGTYSL